MIFNPYPNFERYKHLLRSSLLARAAGNEEGEDEILELLDSLWGTMSSREQAAARQFTRQVSLTYLDDMGNVTHPRGLAASATFREVRMTSSVTPVIVEVVGKRTPTLRAEPTLEFCTL